MRSLLALFFLFALSFAAESEASVDSEAVDYDKYYKINLTCICVLVAIIAILVIVLLVIGLIKSKNHKKNHAKSKYQDI